MSMPGMTAAQKPQQTQRTTSCKVCGDEASGFHYGVDSCEGCKGFFRRCITQGMNHRCSNDEKCEITPFSRNSCQYCRLKKCFAVGMSREASRLGRRPKRLKDSANDANSRNHTSPPCTPYPPLSPLHLGGLTMAQLQKILAEKNGTNKMPNYFNQSHHIMGSSPRDNFMQYAHPSTQQEMPNRSPPDSDSGYSTFSADTPSSGKSHSPVMPPFSSYGDIKTESRPSCQMGSSPLAGHPMMQGMMPDFGGMMPDLSSMMQFPQRPFSESVPALEPLPRDEEIIQNLIEISEQPLTDERQRLVDQVSNAIVEAHMETCIVTKDKVAKKLDLFLKRQTENKSDDLDNMKMDPKKMWPIFLNNMVPIITRVVKFCKRLPGFLELCQEDQIKLIKQGSFEVMLSRFMPLVNHEKLTMFEPDMAFEIPRAAICQMPFGDFFDGFFMLAAHFNPLKLNDAEMAMLTAIAIMCPDREGLSNQKAIQKLESVFIQAFHLYLNKEYPGQPTRFHDVLKMIPYLRRVNTEHAKALNSVKMVSPDISEELPDLHSEVFST